MKRVLLASTALVLLASTHSFAADEINVDSHLRAVTVYTNRAALTRQAMIDLPAGAHTLVFKGLSASLLPDSLRAEGKSQADVKLGAVSSKIIPGDELVAPHEKELSDELQALQDKVVLINAEKQALSQEQSFINTLSTGESSRAQDKIAAGDIKPAQWTAAAQAIHSGIAGALKEQAAQDIALRNINKEIEKTQQEINQLHTGQRNTYEVMIPVETSQAAQLTLDLSYQLPNATWTPLYDARLDVDKGTLELTQYGAVRQQTGEDWTGVALTLSTAQPQHGAGLPALQTMWVNLYQRVVAGAKSIDAEYRSSIDQGNMQRIGVSHMDIPAAINGGSAIKPPTAPEAKSTDVLEEWKKVSESSRMKSARDAVDEENQTPFPMRAASFNTATIETGGFIGEYKIPGPSTVKSDGTVSKVMISTFKTDSNILVQVKPQLSTEAYLIVHTKLKGDAPILPGTVSLFRDGSFMGQSRLPLLRPGEENDLSFGIDDQVSVKRKIDKDEHGEAGIISSDNVQERRFVTTLQNLHDRKMDVAVMETIPVGNDAKIGVTIEPDATTAGYKEDAGNVKGQLKWDIPLEAQQKSDVKLGWKVTWPKDDQINGL